MEENISSINPELKTYFFFCLMSRCLPINLLGAIPYLGDFFLAWMDILCLLVFTGSLHQVGIVGHSIEQGRHFGSGIHLLLPSGAEDSKHEDKLQ